MEISKIHLSSAEMELVQNAEIILTKNRVLQKMKSLLEMVQLQQLSLAETNGLTNEVFLVPPKISRGENYLGLPYLILDYPRRSSDTSFFFIRTMFWWGNFFSCTLHLSANTKNNFKERIKTSYSELQNFYISINENPWVHYLEGTDYCKIESLTRKEFEEVCESFDHIKIAAKHSLAEWEKAPNALFENWKFFLSVCGLIS